MAVTATFALFIFRPGCVTPWLVFSCCFTGNQDFELLPVIYLVKICEF